MTVIHILFWIWIYYIWYILLVVKIIPSTLFSAFLKPKTCIYFQKHQSNQNGFVVSTQVPSMRKRVDKDRLEGAMLVLTDDTYVGVF